MTPQKKEIKLALCQLKVGTDIEKNIRLAFDALKKAKARGANAILLPEIFLAPYDVKVFKSCAQNDNSPLIKKLALESKKKKLLLIAGTVPELDKGKLYNSSYVFEDGELIGKHRKFHLFDINMQGRISFKESSVFSRGEKVTIINTKFGKIGLAICFDLRFPELFKLMAQKGASVIFVPGAFNTITGPLHWELLLRARALDTQCFIAACSPAMNKKLPYKAWGHSALVDPLGKIIKMLGNNPGSIIEKVDLTTVKKVRNELPVLKQSRIKITL